MPKLSEVKPKKMVTETPSQLPFPVFALCPPTYADNSIKNNPTMKEYSEPIDRERFMAEWYNLYNVLAANALVYIIPPVKGLGDMTYVNSFAYLPHVEDQDTIVLSNFTAEGRPGEEVAAGALFKALGYRVVQCPFKFEGEPELKHLRENLYLGGYGFRSDLRAHRWLTKEFDAKIIPIKETDPILYHLDCSVFPIGAYNTILCAEIMERETVREIEKITNVIPVSRADAHAGICNSLRCEDCVYNSSPLANMKRTDDNYEEERHKNDRLEKICGDLGQELLFFGLPECEKAGAKLSCFCGTLSGMQARY